MTHTLTTHPLIPLTDGQLKQLMTDLNEARVQKLKGLSYLEAWDVKATLIRVFGFGGFSSEVTESEIIRAEQVKQASGDKMNWATTAKVTVRLHIHQLGAVYTETAIAGSKQPDFTESADMAIKSAESDALKRAAIFLGTQFGLSLYNNGQTAEVIKAVLAPGQEWLRGARVYPDVSEQMARAIERPADAATSVAHLKPEGVDDAAHRQNMEHLNSALSAQVKKKAERSGPDVPAALDTSLDRRTAADTSGEPVEMDPDYGGDGGKSEGMAYENV